MRTFKKIDVFFFGEYLHSTNSYKTCKSAVDGALNSAKRFPNLVVSKRILANPKGLKAYFDKTRR